MAKKVSGGKQMMDDKAAGKTVIEQVIIQVTEEHHIAQARQAARALAEGSGFGQLAAYYISTSVSELANDLFFHATRGGAITLTLVGRNGDTGLEVIAEDDGPGIPDVESAMQDGFTTNSGLGGGLPGVERLMDEFEITSVVGVGTQIVARKWLRCR